MATDFVLAFEAYAASTFAVASHTFDLEQFLHKLRVSLNSIGARWWNRFTQLQQQFAINARTKSGMLVNLCIIFGLNVGIVFAFAP